MVAGDNSQPVDCLIVGGGPGGYVAALRAAMHGRSVMIVEADRLGGVCLNSGCIPSKALIELARHEAYNQRLLRGSIASGGFEIDLGLFQDWKNGVVDGLVKGIDALLSSARVEVIKGKARFAGRTRIAIQRSEDAFQLVDFKDLVIATGSQPAELPSLPFDGSMICDSTAALAWTEIPSTLVVIGGGYVGLELAVAYSQLGSRVVLTEIDERLIPRMDRDLSAAALNGARLAGVEVLLRSSVKGLEAGEAAITTPEGERRIPASRVLVAVGRRARSDLDFATGGLESAATPFNVDAQLRVNRHVFAIGDATTGPALAHRASAQGRVVGDVLGGQRVAFDPTVIPEVVFCSPEIANVGITLDEARAQGAEAAVSRFPLKALGRAMIANAESGWLKIVYDTAGGRVLGVQIASPHAAEVIGEAALAIEMGATVTDIALTIHPHPGFGEALAEASEVAMGVPIHVPWRSARRD